MNLLVLLLVLLQLVVGSSGILWPGLGYRWGWRSRYWNPETVEDKKVEKPLVEKPLAASDPNVCSFKKPVMRYSRFGSRRGCIDIWGRRMTFFETVYKCCPGFKRVPGKPGCPEEIYTSTKNIPEVARELGLNQFLNYAGQTGVEKLLRGKGPFTVFMPSNEAFSRLPQATLDKLKNGKWARYFLQYHVVKGKLIAETLKHGMNLSSHEFNEPLRVSVTKCLTCDKEKTIVVEGANVSQPNQGASNGIIHVIDRVLLPPRYTIMETLERDPDQRFTILEQALVSSSLNLTGQWTLFAPTDEAFMKLSNETLEKLMQRNECLQALVKNHFTRGYLFSQSVQPSFTYTFKSLEGNELCLTRNTSGDLTIDNEIKISEKDVRARDGVIHVVDEVLFPTSAMDAVMLAQHLNLHEIAKLLKAFGIAEKLEGKGPHTIFAPTDEAFEKVSNATKQNLDLLGKILKYHVVEGMVASKEFKNNEMLSSLLKPYKLQISSFKYGVVTVEGVWLRRLSFVGCNVIIHIIDKVLVPPAGNLLKILDATPELSFFRSLVTNTSVEAKFAGAEPYTVFAPSNDAFVKIGEDKLGDLVEDKQKIESVLKRHVISGTVYSCAITCHSRLWYRRRCTYGYVNNLMYESLAFKKCRGRDLQIAGIKVNTTDIRATNGVLYIIDDVIGVTPPSSGWSWSDYYSLD